ncbi:MAG: hypothetical protein MK135_04000, partial [Polyangiaceae bacterium]|nr:hypothetical protein [Polyangiaceae bacterium]
KNRGAFLGSGELLENSSLKESTRLGNRTFAEQLLAWTVHRRSLVSIPGKSLKSANISLTEESLSSLMRYVLLWMPGLAALLGLALLSYRKKQDRKQP